MKKRFYLLFLLLLLVLAAGGVHWYEQHLSSGHESSAGEFIVAPHIRPHRIAVAHLSHFVVPVRFAVLSRVPYKFPVIAVSGGCGNTIRPPPGV